jgi:hypothetical protein
MARRISVPSLTVKARHRRDAEALFLFRGQRARHGVRMPLVAIRCSCAERSKPAARSCTGRAGGDQRAAGRKRRAKAGRADARWLLQRLCEGRLPEAWSPPEHVSQWRSRARLRNTLVAERTSWTQRIRATLYHHGVAGSPDELRMLGRRRFLAELQLTGDTRERIRIALEVFDLLDARLAEIERDLRALARAQPGILGADGPVWIGSSRPSSAADLT